MARRLVSLTRVLQQATSPACDCSWAHHHLDSHGPERNGRRTLARQLPCAEQVLVRVLVQLLQRRQPRRAVHVLVRYSDLHGLGVRLPGTCLLFTFNDHNCFFFLVFVFCLPILFVSQ